MCAAVGRAQCHHTRVNYRSVVSAGNEPKVFSCSLLSDTSPGGWGQRKPFQLITVCASTGLLQFHEIQFLFLNSFSAHTKNQDGHVSRGIFLVRSSRLKELLE